MPQLSQWGSLSLTARRGQPLVRSIRFPAGVDLTGHTVRSRVREYPDAAGVLIDMPHRAYPFADTVPASSSVMVDKTGPSPVSLILLWIPQPTIDGLQPFATNGTEPGAPLRKSWSCIVTPPGDLPGAWFVGDFFIFPGDPA